MTFTKEPTGYEKTILSDLQGAWECLRDAVIKHNRFERQNDLIFHIEEATSWESVRNIDAMDKAFLLIKNIIVQSKLDEDVGFWLSELDNVFTEVKSRIANGETL